MYLLDPREPVNAWSHGAGMMLALPVTWLLWKRSRELIACRCPLLRECSKVGRWCCATHYQRIKAVCLLIFGVSLIFCYGTSALFHGTRSVGESLIRFQRLDHIGIFLLIAGSYTPVAWALLTGAWWWGTLATVWTISAMCATRVWCGGVFPIWLSTLIYLAMGWGSLFCYRELARTHTHRTLLPLPLGGLFYSVGALFNLLRWPVLSPGVFGAHELFHLFVIAGSACHVYFMIKVVIPARDPAPSRSRGLTSRPRPASPRTPEFIPRLRWIQSMMGTGSRILADEEHRAIPPDNAVEMA
jgi:hemolysin III